MKKKIVYVLSLLAIVALISSCASQKYGCPSNPQASYRFRG